MTDQPKPCQNEDVRACSQSYPQTLYLIQRARKHGLAGTVRRILTKLGLMNRRIDDRKEAGSKVPITWNESLGLQPGDLVEVRTVEEIRATLDENGRHKGLVLMPEMLKYAGRQLKVYKRVERILLEGTGELRRMKNTVLLDGAICDGYQGACDRSCFFFWREAWLRKVEQDK